MITTRDQHMASPANNKSHATRKHSLLHAILVASVSAILVVAGCGGGGSANRGVGTSGTATNSVALKVNAGPALSFINGGFTSITVCAPGSTTNCVTVDNVLVDTGSAGLRVLSSVLTSTPAGAAVAAGLPQSNISGVPLATCVTFADMTVTWGPVKFADMTIGGEKASGLPIQVVGDPSFPSSSIPSLCTSGGGTANETVQDLGANAILGVGPFLQDCGPACTSSSTAGLTSVTYFTCPTASTCGLATPTLAQQLQNPAAMFPQDNNGVLIQLPAISASGAPSVDGTLIFGINTQSNNGLGSAKVFGLDANFNFTTTFRAQQTPGFIDSGSNGIFFSDAATTAMPTCSTFTDFYCPASNTNFQATNTGVAPNATVDTVSFTIANAETLLNTGTNTTFNDLGGPFPPIQGQAFFDWGMPFFFGRSVFTGFESRTVSGGPTGPFYAYTNP